MLARRKPPKRCATSVIRHALARDVDVARRTRGSVRRRFVAAILTMAWAAAGERRSSSGSDARKRSMRSRNTRDCARSRCRSVWMKSSFCDADMRSSTKRQTSARFAARGSSLRRPVATVIECGANCARSLPVLPPAADLVRGRALERPVEQRTRGRSDRRNRREPIDRRRVHEHAPHDIPVALRMPVDQRLRDPLRFASRCPPLTSVRAISADMPCMRSLFIESQPNM